MIIRETMGAFLEMEGYDVHQAANGLEALNELERGDCVPCMIVLDLMMPVMDGIEFRQRQLQNPRIAKLPVVVVSGRADLSDIQELASLKIIRKPFEMRHLLQVAGEHCSSA